MSDIAKWVSGIAAFLICAAIIAVWKLIAAKADKKELLDAVNTTRAMLAKVETDYKLAIGRLEVKQEAAVLIVAAAVTRPELAEKILAITGRSDDRMARVTADIVQLFTDSKANTKAIAETEKLLDDLPNRMRSVEENQRRT